MVAATLNSALTAKQVDPPEALQAFADGRSGTSETIARLGLRDSVQLLLALGECGLHPPCLPQGQIDAMTTLFVGLLREAMGDGTLHAGRS